MSQFIKKATIVMDKLKGDLCKFIEDKFTEAVRSVTNTGVWKIDTVIGVSYQIVADEGKIDIKVSGMTNNSLIISSDFVVLNKKLTDFSIPELIAIGNWTETHLENIKVEYLAKRKKLERMETIKSIVTFES